MKTTRFIAMTLICLLPQESVARDLVVFAAASLKEPLDQIAARFGNVVVSYGGSGAVARQVELGAPADVVLLAHPQWMDALENAGTIEGRTDFASNALVLIGTDSQPLTLADINLALGGGRLAMGLTTSVPAGIYGKAALQHLGVWSGVSDHLAEVDSVRAALTLVARQEAPLGIVYATDARVAENVHIKAAFPPESHPVIRYEFGLVTGSDHPRLAAFAAALSGETAQSTMSAAGFLPPSEAQ